MSKQDSSRQDWEEATNELRKEFDKRLRDMERQLRRGLNQEQEEIDEQELDIGNIRENLEVARGKVVGVIRKGDDFVADHPLVLVGAALAAGIVIGALLTAKGRRD